MTEKDRKLTRRRLHPYIPSYINNADETVLCSVCGDKASGYHYSVMSCEGCKGFFRRAVQSSTHAQYECRRERMCDVTKMSRTRCGYCRFKKCVLVGMCSKMVLSDAQRVAKQALIEANRKKKMAIKPLEKMNKCSKYYLEDVNFLSDVKAAFKIAFVYNLEKSDFTIHNLVKCPSHNQEVSALVLSESVSRILTFLKCLPLFNQLTIGDQKLLLRQSTLSIVYVKTILGLKHKLHVIENIDPSLKDSGVYELFKSLQELAKKFEQLELSNNEYILLPLTFLVLDIDLKPLENPEILEQLRQHILHLLPQRWLYRKQQLLLQSVVQLSKNHDSYMYSLQLNDDNVNLVCDFFKLVFNLKEYS